MSDDEWLESTPRQLHALRKRQLEHVQREELLVGILASTTANFSMCRPEKPLTPEVFMMHRLKPQKKIEHPLTGDELFKKMRSLPGQFVKRTS